MAEQRESRCLGLALADAAGPFAHVFALVDTDVLVVQVVDEGLQTVERFTAVIPLTCHFGVLVGRRLSHRLICQFVAFRRGRTEALLCC